MWAPVVEVLPGPEWFGTGMKLGYIVAVRLVETVLGNIFVWSGGVFYTAYEHPVERWGISPHADQGIAGGLMMLEGSLVTLGALAWLFLRLGARERAAPAAARAGRRPPCGNAGRALRPGGIRPDDSAARRSGTSRLARGLLLRARRDQARARPRSGPRGLGHICSLEPSTEGALVSTPEEPESSGSTGTATTTGGGSSSGGYGFQPVAGARLPIPGNAELAVFLIVWIIIAIIWAASDQVGAGAFVTATDRADVRLPDQPRDRQGEPRARAVGRGLQGQTPCRGLTLERRSRRAPARTAASRAGGPPGSGSGTRRSGTRGTAPTRAARVAACSPASEM